MLEVEGGNDELAKDISLHIAAMNPKAATKEDLDPTVVESERALLTEAAKKEAPKANFVIQADVDAPTSVLSELLAAIKPLMDAPLCASTNEEG